MSTSEAATVLGVTRERARQLFHEGRLTGTQLVKPHGRIKICPCSVKDLLDAAPNTHPHPKERAA